MKNYKIINGNTTKYYIDGTKKYTYFKDSDGYESWKEYDKNGNQIYSKDSRGFESWKEYDKNGNNTYFRNSNGYERWTEYDGNGNQIYFKDSDGDERWSSDHPENPKNIKTEIPEDFKPLTF